MSDRQDETMQDSVEDYVLGVLDDAQRAAFEARLLTDVQLQKNVAETKEAWATIGFGNPVAPDAALKDRLMSKIAEDGPIVSTPTKVVPFPTAKQSSVLPLWLGVALAASVAFIIKLETDLGKARDSQNGATSVIAAQELKLAEQDSLLMRLADPTIQPFTLASTGIAKPVMKAWIDHRRHILTLSASSLGAAQAGHAYQLWFIVDGKPVPSMTFKPDASGFAILKSVPMPDADVAAAAITEEPEAGSSAPTSPVLFVGKVSQ